jgi:hypothetical protein
MSPSVISIRVSCRTFLWSGNLIDSNDSRNRFTSSLNDLLQVGKTMDTSSMFDVPIEMLEFLEGDISNPELYQYMVYEEAEARATAFAERVLYLQVQNCVAFNLQFALRS